MRVLESLLIFLAAIYLIQLVIALLVIATLLLFLWCLYKRPREALVLGLALIVLAALSRPIGLVLIAALVSGCIGWALVIRFRRRRPMPRLTYRPDG